MNITDNTDKSEVDNSEKRRYTSKSFDSTRQKFKQYPKLDNSKLSKIPNPEISIKSIKKRKVRKRCIYQYIFI